MSSAKQFDNVWSVGAFASAAEINEFTARHGIRSMLYLVPTTEAAFSPALQTTCESSRVEYRHVPLQAPEGLTAETAAALQAAVAVMPRPLCIACASGRRASAVVVLDAIRSGVIGHLDELQGFVAQHELPLTPALTAWLRAAFLAAYPSRNLVFRQLFEQTSWTYTYLLGCRQTGEAILIDPVLETAERDTQLASELGLRLKFAINTHVHADHITGTAALRRRVPECKSVLAEVSGGRADVFVRQGDIIRFGTQAVSVRSTPGHTNGCISLVTGDHTMVFTGDALFVRGCGRTDFQQGNSERLYDAIYTQIFTLPDECLVYPGHDYKGHTVSTVGEEKRLNPRLTKSKPDFVTLMANLNLPPPKKLHESLPRNLIDGEEL